MKTIFDKAAREQLMERINTVTEACKPQWGKMTAYQMLKHCRLWEEMILSKAVYKQSFIGRLFGKMALKQMIKDDKPLRRNTPTIPQFKITGNGDVQEEKAKWLALMNEHTVFSIPGFVHPFFGKMTKEEIGIMAYKHTDHHLRQFNR